MTRSAKVIISIIILLVCVGLAALKDGSQQSEKSARVVLTIGVVAWLYIWMRPTIAADKAGKRITWIVVKNYIPWVMAALLLIMLLITVTSTAQSYVDSSKILCNHRLKNTTTNGVDIKITVPCDFDTNNSERPSVVQEYLLRPAENELIGIILSVNKATSPITQDDLIKAIKNAKLKDAKILSHRPVSIDRNTWTEILFEGEKDMAVGKIYQKFYSYVLAYKNNSINLVFKIITFSKEKTDKLFAEWELIFRSLAGHVIIYNDY